MVPGAASDDVPSKFAYREVIPPLDGAAFDAIARKITTSGVWPLQSQTGA